MIILLKCPIQLISRYNSVLGVDCRFESEITQNKKICEDLNRIKTRTLGNYCWSGTEWKTWKIWLANSNLIICETNAFDITIY